MTRQLIGQKHRFRCTTQVRLGHVFFTKKPEDATKRTKTFSKKPIQEFVNKATQILKEDVLGRCFWNKQQYGTKTLQQQLHPQNSISLGDHFSG